VIIVLGEVMAEKGRLIELFIGWDLMAWAGRWVVVFRVRGSLAAGNDKSVDCDVNLCY